MNRNILILISLTAVMLFPSIAAAQGLSIFAKQRLVVAEIIDNNDRPLNPAIKTLIYKGLTDALASSEEYEVYEINYDDVKKQLTAKGKDHSFTNICNQIGNTADFILFTSVKSSTSAYGALAQSVTINISTSLYRISTASEVLSDMGKSEPNEHDLTQTAFQLVSRMLGIQSQKVGSRPSDRPSSPRPPYSAGPQDYIENAGCNINMKMVYVEGSTFQMGATSEQSGAESDEFPVHSVNLDSYYIAATEVTQAQWQAVMGTTIHQQASKAGYSVQSVGGEYPMYYVSWEEAQAFCRELSNMTGRTYLLPTEAQWEFAARGGIKSRANQYAGSYSVDAVAWYASNSGGTQHLVAKLRANELGLYDMSGNVWEWCSDWYGTYSSGAQSNPAGPSSGSSRVLRGGSWRNSAGNCRMAGRNYYSPSSRSSYCGFRVVCIP